MNQAETEKRLLLHRFPWSYPTDPVLKLGKEIGEPYCLQFDDKGYDQKNSRSFTRDEAIPKIAERVTDDQLVSFFAKPEIKAEASKYTFMGKVYTLKGGELKLGSEWPSLKAALQRLVSKHGENLRAMLKACYEVFVEKHMQFNNFLLVQARAEQLGADKGWRKALSVLQLEGIVTRGGDLQIPDELIPLVREFLDEFEGEKESVEETGVEKEPEEIPITKVKPKYHDRLKEIIVECLSLEDLEDLLQITHYLVREKRAAIFKRLGWKPPKYLKCPHLKDECPILPKGKLRRG